MIRIIGSYLSPYVRKVLVALELKGLPYEIDPIVPFMGDERFSLLSPLRRIPVYSDERVTLTDSSVICQYLEDTHPEPALYPLDVAERAQARWLEEYADTRLADVLIWGLFNETMIAPAVWGRAPDPDKIARVRRRTAACTSNSSRVTRSKRVSPDCSTLLKFCSRSRRSATRLSGSEPANRLARSSIRRGSNAMTAI